MYVDSFHKTVCFFVSVTDKKKKKYTECLRQHCESPTNIEPMKMNFLFTDQMGEDSEGGRVKLDPLIKEVLVTSDGVSPFGLKPFVFL